MSNNRNNKSKYWVFTINNYGQNEEDTLAALVQGEDPICSYVGYGREVAPSTGTRHLQGYLELSKRRRFNQVRDVLPAGAHIERRMGTAEQAREYCEKEGDFIEHGEISISEQGKRTDLERVEQLVKSGASLSKICEDEFSSFVKFGRGITTARTLLGKKRNREEAPEVIVFWGVTGSGKTRKVFEDNPELDIYSHPGGQWFDGYDGQEIALFDDFGGSEFKLTYLLKLLDRYPMKVPVKGSFVNWIPTKIYLTSNMDPDSWYSNANSEHQAALRRRFTQVTHFNGIN